MWWTDVPGRQIFHRSFPISLFGLLLFDFLEFCTRNKYSEGKLFFLDGAYGMDGNVEKSHHTKVLLHP